MLYTLIEYLAKKFIDIGFEWVGNRALVAAKRRKLQSAKGRSIAGIWVCQYYYPRLDEKILTKVTAVETQLVRFIQKDCSVYGSTIHADAHPEGFEGIITKDRYFTGMFYNQKNHQSYHGAFQFVLSNSHSRMEGRWIGFSREGERVDSYEWRWEQLDDSPDISPEKEHEYLKATKKINLFENVKFL